MDADHGTPQALLINGDYKNNFFPGYILIATLIFPAKLRILNSGGK